MRVGNQAAEQLQHDAYGSVILGASQMFIDERLPRMGDADLFRRLEPLGVQARRFALEPDAGPWEYRGRQRVHTHSATMCWVACDRLARIAARLGLADRAAHWRGEAEALRDEILKRAWNERRGALAGALDHDELDASVLLLPELGLLPANDERFVRTCALIGKELSRNGFIMRYTAEDDFGLPETAFLVCQFWYIDALDSLGRKRRRGSCSPIFSRAATASACCRRTSIPPPASFGATCRRPTRWRVSSTRAASSRAAGRKPGRRPEAIAAVPAGRRTSDHGLVIPVHLRDGSRFGASRRGEAIWRCQNA